MLFGDTQIFAIECQIVESTYKDVQAHFRMWADSQPIGDYEDPVLLRACLNWLTDFMSYSDVRREPSLDNKTKEEVFRLIFDSVMLTVPKGKTLSDALEDELKLPNPDPVVYPNARERFHLDQVGMSSFSDKWNVLLVERSDGSQRLLWRNLDDMRVSQRLLPPGYFDEVASQFIQWANTVI